VVELPAEAGPRLPVLRAERHDHEQNQDDYAGEFQESAHPSPKPGNQVDSLRFQPIVLNLLARNFLTAADKPGSPRLNELAFVISIGAVVTFPGQSTGVPWEQGNKQGSG
jgi:hypothetical protein